MSTTVLSSLLMANPVMPTAFVTNGHSTTAFATKLMKDKMAAMDVPPVREYLQMLVDGGAKLYACKRRSI